MSYITAALPFVLLGYLLPAAPSHRHQGRAQTPSDHDAARFVAAFAIANFALHAISVWLPLVLGIVLADVAWKHRSRIGGKLASAWTRIQTGGTV